MLIIPILWEPEEKIFQTKTIILLAWAKGYYFLREEVKLRFRKERTPLQGQVREVLSLRAPLLTVSLEGGDFTGCSVCDSEW